MNDGRPPASSRSIPTRHPRRPRPPPSPASLPLRPPCPSSLPPSPPPSLRPPLPPRKGQNWPNSAQVWSTFPNHGRNRAALAEMCPLLVAIGPAPVGISRHVIEIGPTWIYLSPMLDDTGRILPTSARIRSKPSRYRPVGLSCRVDRPEIGKTWWSSNRICSKPVRNWSIWVPTWPISV